ncbi:MAG: serine--tRNA ligase [Candidatus Doudnabacteria bacterium RIFCSPHIGHO2_02_FULL_46_11]|uniref:Serine--tRNA ligase n=1 Tax=Candidatus Doudnabacteria bacterium RIFCSPHIGHO2_02_FULL_46_11 TaxID=1817832 RepID=A0A1F5P5M7_9BACT|nr:MAG: serine--tRNA ligase [Candidatus Doudnabacteria bacterium RIFCSPHIGHO2_02_FULL_46_11]
MLDIKLIRENPDKVKKGIAAKGAPADLVGQVLKVDTERRKLQTELDVIKAEKNKLGKEIGKLSPEERDARIAGLRAQDVKADALEENFKKASEELTKILSRIPNLPDDGVPSGRDETENVVAKTVGQPTKFKFDHTDYLTLAHEMDLVDTEAAAKVSGSRFGYLKGAAACLQFALGQHVLNTLTNPKIIEKIAKSVDNSLTRVPFVPVVPPVMIREDAYWKTARIDLEDKEERYYIPKDELYLIGSAEHTLAPMHMDEILNENELPKRYLGFSTAFRREAGTYGKDTKGIIRVHQFDKWEMEVFADPKNSRTEYEFIIAVQEYLVSSLGLPYRVMLKCTGDIGGPNARGVDIDVWLPGENNYRETHTADFMTDYQTRRLNTRLRRPNGDLEFVHTIDATAFAIGRMIVAIIENYQQADGSIKVPKVLQKYLPFKEIKGPFGMGNN